MGKALWMLWHSDPRVAGCCGRWVRVALSVVYRAEEGVDELRLPPHKHRDRVQVVVERRRVPARAQALDEEERAGGGARGPALHLSVVPVAQA